MHVVVANKGAAGYRVQVRGHSVHSALRDRGVSAVEQAAEIIVFIGRLQRELDAAARHDGFDYPHTSVHVGLVHGGTAHNITAKECEFVLEIRTLPGMRATDVLDTVRRHCDEVVLPAMRRIAADTGISFEEIFDTPPLDERGNESLAQTLAPLCGNAERRRVSFGTEGGILQAIGVQTVVCGPGDIAVAHQPDEYVELAQLERCSAFLDALGRRLAEPSS
jgi:acetylornithine deacetylase